MIKIRPFQATNDEYEAVVSVVNRVWPDYPEAVSEWKHNDATRNPEHFYQREVFEVDGRIVGYGLHCKAWWEDLPNRYFAYADIDPDYQGYGIGRLWYAQTEPHLLALGAAGISSSTREDKVAGVQFLEKRAYKQVLREPTSMLDVPSFAFGRYGWTEEKMAAQGIRLLSVAELAATDPHWKVNLHDATWTISLDVPREAPPTRRTQEEFETQVLARPDFDPNLHFLAVESGTEQIVGYSALWLSEAQPEALFTGLTGVVREHRRRGIATALKVRAIREAHERGVTAIKTDNEENNPMYALNLQLGFEPQPAWLIYRKEFGNGESKE